eukprot:TRINITY_DN51708_c0_g1_i3.p2 TRINITY_DN51708_c0_g1~~TRINITY_DN51708_c0_g1_i3.p2  ORF type:complete len:101 (+),score=2.64 TRINITY_DN51708_c0_g1_i3:288-590(+)
MVHSFSAKSHLVVVVIAAIAFCWFPLFGAIRTSSSDEDGLSKKYKSFFEFQLEMAYEKMCIEQDYGDPTGAVDSRHRFAYSKEFLCGDYRPPLPSNRDSR